jgi:hypothetical protein
MMIVQSKLIGPFPAAVWASSIAAAPAGVYRSGLRKSVIVAERRAVL